MANTRMISSLIWEDDLFTSLTMFERLVWIGIITACADDQGRFQDNANLIIAKVFPLDDINKADIEAALNRFAATGKLHRYIAKGKKLAQITNWWKHQKPRWAGASNYPPPDKWIDRERYHTAGNVISEKNWKLQGGYKEGYLATYTTNDVNGDVNGDDDIDGDGDKQHTVAAISRPNVYAVYEREIGALTGTIAGYLDAALKDYPEDWIIEAFQESARQNKRSWAYASAILKNRQAGGTATRDNSNGRKPSKPVDTSLDDLIRSGK
ncbi:MAG: DnaD domain protein [Saccharofermentanales bacterium]